MGVLGRVLEGSRRRAAQWGVRNEKPLGRRQAVVAVPHSDTATSDTAAYGSVKQPDTAAYGSVKQPDTAAYGSVKQPDTAAYGSVPHFCTETNEVSNPCDAQWLMLWSVAAYIPPRPTESQKEDILTFYHKFPDQCTKGPAAGCYSRALQYFQPRVETRRDLMLWLGTVENQCRLELHQPIRTMRYDELMRRWRGVAGTDEH